MTQKSNLFLVSMKANCFWTARATVMLLKQEDNSIIKGKTTKILAAVSVELYWLVMYIV